jgi:O-antigen ligase
MDAHNIYLQLGVEVGVIGLALFLVAVLSLLRGLRSIRSQAPGPMPAAYLEAALVGLLSYGFFHGVLVEKFFWLAVGLSMLVTLRAVEKVKQEEEGIKSELPVLLAVEGEWRQR